MQYVCKKDRLTKFTNAENSNNANQGKIVVELRETLRLSEMRHKEVKFNLLNLKKLMR